MKLRAFSVGKLTSPRSKTPISVQKVYDGAENETIVDTPPTEFADRITDVVKFMMHLMDQREKLSKAIHAAKNALPIDMDSEVV